MTDRTILIKALKKAIAGGYDGKLPVASDSPTHEWHPYGLIFNRRFAKALWPGAPIVKEGFWKGLPAPNWQRHLRDMVIADDPLKYLAEHWDDGDLPSLADRNHAALNPQAVDD